jgi:hypothetical protein
MSVMPAPEWGRKWFFRNIYAKKWEKVEESG